MLEEEILRKLIVKRDGLVNNAPSKTERFGIHYEFIVNIGDNESASIIIPKEAYDILNIRDYKKSINPKNKPTNINIGKYYGLSPEILSQYSNGKRGENKKRLYDALKSNFKDTHL